MHNNTNVLSLEYSFDVNQKLLYDVTKSFFETEEKNNWDLGYKNKEATIHFFVRNGNSVASCTILLVSSHFIFLQIVLLRDKT